jgi:hypothetical protein
VHPVMIRKSHLLSPSLNKPARSVNPADASKNRCAQRVF